MSVQKSLVDRAIVPTPIRADSGVRYAVGAALCLFVALVSGYCCLTQLVFTRSANISNSANYSNLKDVDRQLPLSSARFSLGEKTVSRGFDGFVWIGSWANPRISIETSADVLQIQVADQLLQPSCHALPGAGDRTDVITPRFRCDVDVSGLPRNRFQRLVVALSDSNATFTLVIAATAVSALAMLLGCTALIAILASVFLLCRAAHQSWIISAISAIGLGERLIYWAKTPPLIRGHDAFGHVQYVTHVALYWTRPNRNAGFEFHHPPLYYYVGACVVSLARLFGFHSAGATLSLLQGLSFALSVLMAIAAFFCFKECGRLFCSDAGMRKHAVAMAFGLYVFWPTAVIDSVRIGNDSLLMLLTAIFLFYILRWQSQQSPRALVIASLAAALAIVTKASAILLLPVLCLAAALEWRAQPTKRAVYKHLLWLAPVFLFAGFITFAPGLQERMSNRNTSVLIASHAPGPEFAVGNRPGNYLRFNPVKFVLNPFTDLFRDEYGRQKFWYYFWKTSLFGEFRQPGRFERLCASGLSGLLLLLLILTFFGIIFCAAKRPKPLASMLVFAVVWIIGTLGFSVLQPFSASRDFRYAAPALICICWFAALSHSWFAAKGWSRIARCADILLLLFISGSVSFVMGLPFYP